MRLGVAWLPFVALASVAASLGSSSVAHADTFTIHATLDPASRRHVADKFGFPTEWFTCSYEPLVVNLAANDTVTVSIEVAGGGFVATTRPGIELGISVIDTTSSGTCPRSYDGSTYQSSTSDLALFGDALPTIRNASSYYSDSGFLLAGLTGEASSPFRVTSVALSRPMVTASSSTHQSCDCQWSFSAYDDDRPLVWGPGVPRNVGTLLETTAQPTPQQCPYGGAVILRGHDDGFGGAAVGDGVLDSREVEDTEVICAGANGGHATLVTTESAGLFCSNTGGVLIESGADDGSGGGIADDGMLEPGEVQQTRIVCAGASSGCSVTLAGYAQVRAGWLALACVGLAIVLARRRSNVV